MIFRPNWFYISNSTNLSSHVWYSWLFWELIVTISIVICFRSIGLKQNQAALNIIWHKEVKSSPFLWGIIKHNGPLHGIKMLNAAIDRSPQRCPSLQSNQMASVYWLTHSTMKCIYQWFRVHLTYFLYSNPSLIIYGL